MSNPLLNTIRHLREQESLLLHGKLVAAAPAAVGETAIWLSAEYEAEAEGYPYSAPAFDGAAAGWAASTVYHAGQLVVHRGHRPQDAAALLPPYAGTIDAGAALSADLCLRFLPDIVRQLELIDPDDELLPLLRERLAAFHYSAVGYPLPADILTWDAVIANPCLRQLYADRVIARNALHLAALPALQPVIEASIGIHARQLWPAWSLQKQNHESDQ